MKYVVGVWTDKEGELKSHIMRCDSWNVDEYTSDMMEWMLDNLTAREWDGSKVFAS